MQPATVRQSSTDYVEERSRVEDEMAAKKSRGNVWIFIFGGIILLTLFSGFIVAGVQAIQSFLVLQQSSANVKDKFSASLEISKATVATLGTYATIMGGVVLFLNFKVAAQGAETAKAQLKQHSEARFLQETELAQSRLISDRFSHALELFGSHQQGLRMGGIYLLEQIAKESLFYH